MPEFKDGKNSERLAQAFLIANSTKSSEAFLFLRNNKNVTINDAIEIIRQGEKLVDILCYAIMPDHYHLLLKERKEHGITNFIHKCNISIAKYINIKESRSGPLFEGLFKAKHISTNEYLLHLSLYIHLNPLDFLFGKEWREHEIKNWNLVKNKLFNYPWSSLKAFIDENHEDKIISGTEVLLDQFKNKKEYELFLQEWSGESLNIINEIITD
jgi:putative transposase